MLSGAGKIVSRAVNCWEAATPQQEYSQISVGCQTRHLWKRSSAPTHWLAESRSSGGQVARKNRWTSNVRVSPARPMGRSAGSNQSGSLFVVFRRPIATDVSGPADRNFPAYHAAQELVGPWAVRFDPNWGGPEQTVAPPLLQPRATQAPVRTTGRADGLRNAVSTARHPVGRRAPQKTSFVSETRRT